MKEVLTLAAQKRDYVGSSASRRVRRSGSVPCVLYGHKQDTLAIAVEREALESALRHHTRMFDLSLEGKSERVLVNDVQYDAFGLEVIHADFLRVAMDELIQVNIPVLLKGKAKGEEHAGVTEQLLTEVEVECLPGNIPDAITHVVADLEVGQSVKVSDLKAPEGVRIITDPNHLVVTVAALRKAEEVMVAAPGEEAAPGPTEPEVIARGKVEEEEEESEAEAQSRKKEPKEKK